MTNHNYQFATKTIHEGQTIDADHKSRAIPIHQTTSYLFDNVAHAKALFSLQAEGNTYSRIGNPTISMFEKRIAALENGSAAVATSSGQSAITLALLTLAGAGDEIVSATNIYGGTFNLFHSTLKEYGITVHFVDETDIASVEQAITPKTKAIFAETIGNPGLNVIDVEALSRIAKQYHVPLVIDNTFATPYVFRPIEAGADIVVHSATKWIGGHGTSIGGVIVDSGLFDWNHERFPKFTEPQESYHGSIFANDFDNLGYITRVRAILLRDFGANLSPFNAFQLLQGLETLHVRVDRHNENALDIATYLEAHEQVEWIRYPGLASDPAYKIATEQFENGYGSVVVFGIKGGRKAAESFIDYVQLWSHLANVGDAKSLIIHPASTTHLQLSDDDLEKSGVTEEMIRLSVGIEDIHDITADLEQAFQHVKQKIDV